MLEVPLCRIHVELETVLGKDRFGRLFWRLPSAIKYKRFADRVLSSECLDRDLEALCVVFMVGDVGDSV